MNRRAPALAVLLLSCLILTAGCSPDSPGPVAVDTPPEIIDGTDDPGTGGPGTDRIGETEESESGNNLSFPVIWSDGPALPLRGTFGAPQLSGAAEVVDGVAWYRQQDPGSSWQASARDGSAAPVVVDWVNWGDNLEARPWRETSKVRAEVVLLQDLAAAADGFRMLHLSGHGQDEMWGTDGEIVASAQATVYSHFARFTIQKLTADPAAADLAWDPDQGCWTGDVLPPVFNHAVCETAKSRGDRYSAEINIQGKVIYGMLWDVAETAQGPGVYRLTFSLTGVDPAVTRNTSFGPATAVVPSSEEGEKSGEPAGAVPVIVPEADLTYVDVTIVADTDGGGAGGGAGGGPGGGR